MSSRTITAVFVHLLTASGVLCALFAFMAIANHDNKTVFLWLGLALIIDTVDGPLARLVDTKTNLPRFSGERLDLIIDYLNYVVLPAFVVVMMPVINGATGYLAASIILMTSLFHFSDLSSKTIDGYFVGFPAVWNIVLFYILVFEISGATAFILILALAVMTFVPLRWLHPFRVERLRVLTGAVVVVWFVVALWVILNGFATGPIEKAVFVGAGVYLVALSMKRTMETTP